MAIIKIVRKKQKQKGQSSHSHEPSVDLNPPSHSTAMTKDAYSMMPMRVGRRYSSFLTGALIGLITCFGALYTGIKHLNGDWLPISLAPSAVYFELKVLSKDGRPIAGAKVTHNKKRIGTTDSFGEWRRYIKVDPGANFAIHVSKNMSGHLVSANKNFLVPMDIVDKKDVKLTTSIILDLNEKNEGSDQPAENTRTEPAPLLAQRPLNEPMLNEIQFKIDTTAPHEKNAVLTAHLLPALNQLANAQGLKVTPAADWQVSLKHLPPIHHTKAFAGVLQVSAVTKNQNEPSVFLANYTGSSEKTAEGILKDLKLHFAQHYPVLKSSLGWFVKQINYAAPFWEIDEGHPLKSQDAKTFVTFGVYRQGNHRLFKIAERDSAPCEGQEESQCRLTSLALPEFGPDRSFVPLKVKIPGTSSMQVFSQGFAAIQEKPELWRYWGKDHVEANLTIVANGKIIHRERLMGRTRDVSTVTLNSTSTQPMAKKSYAPTSF